MRYRQMGNKALKAAGYRCTNGAVYADISGFPKSGAACQLIDSFGESIPTGSVVVDVTTGVAFVNEGTSAAPYWTPTSFNQRGLLGWRADMRDGVGKPLANTATTLTLDGTGLRIHGQGIDETDSGFVVTTGDGLVTGRMTTTDEDEHTCVLSFGTGTVPLFQPDLNGTIVVDANISHVSAITLRAFFFGFTGSAADALDPLINGATATISYPATIGDDLAGICFDVGLTDPDRLYAAYVKGDAVASRATTDTGIDLGVDVAAADTYQRLRVEVDADGGVRMFVNKALVGTFDAALDTDEEIHPVLQLISESAATKSLDVKHFSAWGKRA